MSNLETEKETTLGWSTEAPTEPGYYWVRPKGSSVKSVILVDKFGGLRRFGAEIDKAEFAGPFPRPPRT
jgi:hypothetical protein